MAKVIAIKYLDRVRRSDSTSSRATATVVDVHSGSKSKSTANTVGFSVLPDDRPRSLGLVVWEAAETVKVSAARRACPVCEGDHLIFYCPERV